VAGADDSLGVLSDIDDREEVRSQFTVFLFHGEILLVVAHDVTRISSGRLRKAGSKSP